MLASFLRCEGVIVTFGRALCGASTMMKEPSCLHLCTHQLFLVRTFPLQTLGPHPRDSDILDLG